MRVGLADDQQLVRAGFKMVLESDDDIEVVWEADDGVQACEYAEAHPVDVILMDVQMPKMDGVEATRRIVEQGFARVIVLTTFDSENYVVGAINSGASGFLLKDTAPDELIEAVKSIDEQSAIISPAATAVLFKTLRATSNPEFVAGPGSASSAGLTMREQEVLVLMARGYNNSEIAAELFVSMPTVKTHVSNILMKTNSRDRVQAVLWAFSKKLVAPAELLDRA